MLTSTFCCFDGVSRSAERRLWDSGCLSWNALSVLDQKAFSRSKQERVRAQIVHARRALRVGRVYYFLERLRPPDTIRILPHFLEGLGYLDVETTGLDEEARLTTVALVDSRRARCFISGFNLEKLPKALEDITLLVTYNGEAFDLPIIRRELRIALEPPHLDLRPCLESLGYRGGLKRCEELAGIERETEERLTGQDAVALWSRHCKDGDDDALVRLVRYNLRDALSLEELAVKVYNEVMSSYPRAIALSIPAHRSTETLTLEDVL